MTSLLLICALIGTTLIVTSSVLFKPIRKLWPTFFGCNQCIGTWVGVAFGISGVVSLGYGRWLDAFIVGTATSFLSQLADGILTLLLGEPDDEGNAHAKKTEKSEE